MHPFILNAIALVARFLNAEVPHSPSTRSTVDAVQGRQDAVNDLLSALRRISQVNKFAAELLYKLELDMGQAMNNHNASQLDQTDDTWT